MFDDIISQQYTDAPEVMAATGLTWTEICMVCSSSNEDTSTRYEMNEALKAVVEFSKAQFESLLDKKVCAQIACICNWTNMTKTYCQPKIMQLLEEHPGLRHSNPRKCMAKIMLYLKLTEREREMARPPPLLPPSDKRYLLDK